MSFQECFLSRLEVDSFISCIHEFLPGFQCSPSMRSCLCLFLMWLKKTTLLMLTGGTINSAWYLSLTHTLTHAPKHLIALLSWPNFCGVSDSVGLAMVISRYLSALSVRMQSPTVRRQQAEQRTWKHLDLYPPTLRNRKWALCDLLSGWWAVCWLPGLLFPSWFLQLQRLESMRDRRSQQYSTPPLGLITVL